MENPFNYWLRRFQGKSVDISTQVGNKDRDYDGTIIMIDDEVVLTKEGNNIHVISVDHIIHLTIPSSYKLGNRKRKTNDNKFWKWLNHLEGKEAEIMMARDRYNYSVEGIIHRIDNRICFIRVKKSKNYFEKTEDLVVICIDDIVEINALANVFEIRSEVKIEEIIK